MSLEIPDLDDKKFSELVDEALKIIPQYNPEWTNYNPADPGVMLIELFAWLTESTLFKLDHVTDRTKLKFLKLLNVDIDENDFANDPELAIENGIKEVFCTNTGVRAVTDQDYHDIVLNILKKNNISGKSYIINNYDFSRYDIDPDTVLNQKEGHVSIIVIPDCRINEIEGYSEKKDVFDETIQKVLGDIDDYKAAGINTDDFIIDEPEELFLGDNESVYKGGFGRSVYLYNNLLGVGVPGRVVSEDRLYIYFIDEDNNIKKEDSDFVRNEIFHPLSSEQGAVSGLGNTFILDMHYTAASVPGDEIDPGAVYLYSMDQNSNLYFMQEIKSNAIANGFGENICINNRYAVISAKNAKHEDSTGSNAGEVYVLRRHINGEWHNIAKIIETDSTGTPCREDNNFFGNNISMSGRLLAVCSKKDQGCVYLYKLTNENIEKIIQIIPEDNEDVNFGKSICLNENELIVSTDNNKIYIYKIDDNSDEIITKLTQIKYSVQNNENIDNFGEYVFIDNYTAVFTVLQDNVTWIIIYRKDINDNWILVKNFNIEADYSSFIKSMSFKNDLIALGVPYDPELESSISSGGRCFLYKLPVQTVIDDNYPSPSLLNNIKNEIDKGRIISTRAHLIPPIYRTIKLNITVVKEKRAKDEAIVSNIKYSLLKFYDPVTGGPEGDGYPMGRSIYSSEIINCVENSTGVDYFRKYEVHELVSNEYKLLESALNLYFYEIIKIDLNNTTIDIKSETN